MSEPSIRSVVLDELSQVDGRAPDELEALARSGELLLDSLEIFEVLARLEDRLDLKVRFEAVADVGDLDELVAALEAARTG